VGGYARDTRKNGESDLILQAQSACKIRSWDEECRSGIFPNIELKERYLEVREAKTNVVIAVIEVLSPKNKRSGEGRESYLRKRQLILSSQSHLVEIDLLRAHEAMPMVDAEVATDYRILVSDSNQRPFANLYGFNLRDAIPQFFCR
jgi:hypothetical protein